MDTSLSEAQVPNNSSSNQSGSNDFVKKLFQMLQEDSYKDVVKWTTNGDSFVVINTNEFTKEILPRHFKHSNFASFVRQLNKYDFHKVKIPNEEKQNYKYGEDAWEFKHPDFRINDREALDNIKRKGPTAKKYNQLSGAGDSSMNSQVQQMSDEISMLKQDIKSLVQDNKSIQSELNVVRNKYKTVVENLVGLRNFDERYYRTMTVIVNSLLQSGIKLPPLDIPNPNLMNLQQPMSTHLHSNNITSSPLLPQGPPPHPSSQTQQKQPQNQPVVRQSYNPSYNCMISGGPNTAGSQLQRAAPVPSQQQGKPQSNTATSSLYSAELPPAHLKMEDPQAISSTSTPANTDQTGSSIGVIRHNSVPSIATTNIPNPKFHVLLVEDDNVCIQLCRKFLVKYGCQVTVATDGLNAISTVEHTSYDLVLMDIVMPNLDGATATSIIRSFDQKTPIIAMTGNIEEHDLVTYLNNGMSDILAKPFTKDDLYSILHKYLLTDKSNNATGTGGGNVENVSPSTDQQVLSSHLETTGPVIMDSSIDQKAKKQRLQ